MFIICVCLQLLNVSLAISSVFITNNVSLVVTCVMGHQIVLMPVMNKSVVSGETNTVKIHFE